MFCARWNHICIKDHRPHTDTLLRIRNLDEREKKRFNPCTQGFIYIKDVRRWLHSPLACSSFKFIHFNDLVQLRTISLWKAMISLAFQPYLFCGLQEKRSGKRDVEKRKVILDISSRQCGFFSSFSYPFERKIKRKLFLILPQNCIIDLFFFLLVLLWLNGSGVEVPRPKMLDCIHHRT